MPSFANTQFQALNKKRPRQIRVRGRRGGDTPWRFPCSSTLQRESAAMKAAEARIAGSPSGGSLSNVQEGFPMQIHPQKQSSPTVQHSNLCPKCGSELHVSWCARCFGTGRMGKHECKKCGGTGRMTACPNAHSHKLNLFSIF